MSPLENSLMVAISELVHTKDVKGARVVYKTNDRGETVIALILPKQDAAASARPTAARRSRSSRVIASRVT